MLASPDIHTDLHGSAENEQKFSVGKLNIEMNWGVACATCMVGGAQHGGQGMNSM